MNHPRTPSRLHILRYFLDGLLKEISYVPYTFCLIVILVLSPNAFSSDQTKDFKVAISMVDGLSGNEISRKAYYYSGDKVWIKFGLSSI